MNCKLKALFETAKLLGEKKTYKFTGSRCARWTFEADSFVRNEIMELAGDPASIIAAGTTAKYDFDGASIYIDIDDDYLKSVPKKPTITIYVNL